MKSTEQPFQTYPRAAEMTDEQRIARNRKNRRRRKRQDERRRDFERGVEQGSPALIRKATSRYLVSQLHAERKRSWVLAALLQEAREAR